jgi:hypothetical protein
VRCARVQRDAVGGAHELDSERISLYIELNVAYRLTADDMVAVPQAESKVRLN